MGTCICKPITDFHGRHTCRCLWDVSDWGGLELKIIRLLLLQEIYWTEQKTTLCIIILLGKGYSIFIIMVILRKLWEFLKSDSKFCFSYPVLGFTLAFLPSWLGAAQIAGEQ